MLLVELVEQISYQLRQTSNAISDLTLYLVSTKFDKRIH